MDFDAIKTQMAKDGGATAEDLDYVNSETYASLEKDAVEFDDQEALNLGRWTGNNLIVNGRNWRWQDTPGSQCGRTRTWTYTAAQGASYRKAGNCPQGYAWWEMMIP